MLLWITFVTLSFAKKCESMKIGVVTKPSTEPTFSREMFTSNQGTKRTNMWEIFNPQQTQVWGTAFREEIIKETVSERSETSTSYKTSFSGSSEAVTVFEEFAMDRDGLPFVTAYWLGERWKNCAMSMRGTMSMTGTTIWNEFGENYIEDSSNTKISLWRTNLRLSKALAYHVLLCGDIVSCAGTFSVAQGSGRCCSCSCAEDCFAEGSCCLAMYEDVAHVHTALQNSRYKCTDTKLLSSGETDYLFPKDSRHDIRTRMVSKCDPEYNDKVTITLCEKKQTELDSLVPVTEPLTNTHYKNKYCAYCNGVLTTSYLITWKLLVYSNQYVSFSTKNIVSTTKETRGNIFFIPPDTVKVRQCTSSYTIGTCNVTGDWNVYDKDFETACDIYLDPYTDPFGITYKNIFCYSCNTPTFGIGDGNDEVHCPSQEREKSKVDPAFSAIIDPKSFDKSGNQDSLYCTSHQFEDRKLMLCQDVMCYAGLLLYNGECDVDNVNLEENACFSIFIKLTPTQKVALLTNFLLCDEETFTRSLRKSFDEELGLTNNSTGFLHFRKLDHLSHIDYLVIYAVFGFSSHSEKVYKVKRLIEKKYFTFNPFQIESLSFDLKLELSVYNLNFSDFNFPDVAAELHVTTDFRTSFDTLTETFDSSSVRSAMCSANETIPLTRLHLCPFVKIPVGALSMKITNGFLCVYEDSDSSKIVKVLPKWDYDINDNKILMCLDDYLDLYNAIPAQTSDEAGVESFYTLISFYVIVVVYLF